MEAALIRDKIHVVTSKDHDQMDEEASDSEETPCSSSGSDGEGVGTTLCLPQSLMSFKRINVSRTFLINCDTVSSFMH